MVEHKKETRGLKRAVSASRENKTRATDPHSKIGVKEARAKAKEQEDRKRQTRNTILGGIATVVVLGLVVWNQGFFTTHSPAFTIDGTSYSAGHVNMYYTSPMYSALMGQVLPEEGGTAYDMNLASDEQYYSSFTTWHEYFVTEAVNSLAKMHILSEEAKANGFVLPEEAKEEMAAVQFQLDTAWVGYYGSKKAYIRGQYGEDMTEATYLAVAERELYANHYQTYLYDDFAFDEGEFEDYYEENKNDLDLITFSQFNFATTPLGLETDEETGVEEEATEEQIATFEAEKEAMGVYADELIALVESGATMEEVEEAYASLASSYVVSDVRLSSNFVGNESYGEWLLEEDRVFQDTKKTGEGVGYAATYTVTIYEDRGRMDEVTSNIRHIYIAAVEEGVPTDEEWAEAEENAQSILDEWLANGADMAEFESLAKQYSSDPGSAEVGGLMENVSTMSGYVDTFTEWATDPSRKNGDTGIVKNTGSSVQGWHIMYFEDWSRPMWEISAESGLRVVALEDWQEEIYSDLESKIVYGDGFNDVVPQSLF